MAKRTKKYHLSVFVLAMMNVAIIMSLRGLPMMAKEGLSLVFYLLFSTIFFLIPTALVSAELATGWPHGGGVYSWVREAFGDHLGFAAIWLQWIQNVIWYPTVLSFAAGALAYLFLDPGLAENRFYNIIVILIVYWGATLINLRGMKASGRLTSLGVILGTIVPGVLIILLGICWVILGEPLTFRKDLTIIPDFTQFSHIAFLAGVVLLFAGMEVSAVHAKEVKNPKKDYPKAIFLATLIIFVVFALGSLAIAAVMPPEQIQLTSGIMAAFQHFLHLFKLDWLIPVIGLLIAFGAIGSVTAWIVGPSKGLFHTARMGDLPPFLAKKNKNGMPANILIIQGIIVTLLALVFLCMPTVSSAFFLLTALTAILYLIMYLFLYAAAIRLRYSQANVKRAYKIPGGNAGMWIVAGIGIIAALFSIIVGFFPPKLLAVGSPTFYVLFLVCGVVVVLGLSFLIIELRKPAWKKKIKTAKT